MLEDDIATDTLMVMVLALWSYILAQNLNHLQTLILMSVTRRKLFWNFYLFYLIFFLLVIVKLQFLLKKNKLFSFPWGQAKYPQKVTIDFFFFCRYCRYSYPSGDKNTHIHTYIAPYIPGQYLKAEFCTTYMFSWSPFFKINQI